jgi:hypothetical protein
MTPKQRKPGQTGSGGYTSHGPSMGRSAARGGRPHGSGGGGGKRPGGGCCSMVAAVRSARRGNFRLAARYARMTPRYIGRKFAW